jgi:hypothetical protein
MTLEEQNEMNGNNIQRQQEPLTLEQIERAAKEKKKKQQLAELEQKAAEPKYTRIRTILQNTTYADVMTEFMESDNPQIQFFLEQDVYECLAHYEESEIAFAMGSSLAFTTSRNNWGYGKNGCAPVLVYDLMGVAALYGPFVVSCIVTALLAILLLIFVPALSEPSLDYRIFLLVGCIFAVNCVGLQPLALIWMERMTTKHGSCRLWKLPVVRFNDDCDTDLFLMDVD